VTGSRRSWRIRDVPAAAGACGLVGGGLAYVDTRAVAAAVAVGVLAAVIVGLLLLRRLRAADRPPRGGVPAWAALQTVVLVAGGVVLAVLARSWTVGVAAAALGLFWALFVRRARP
jgi:hypothetical protein